MSNPDPATDSRENCSPQGHGPSKSTAKIGIGLILLSGVFWFSLFAIPFLPLTGGQKAWLAGADFIAVQIAWWVGAGLAGPSVVARLKFWRKTSKDAETK